MGISLTGLTPATTYDALIKVGDNGPITGALKVLSDGLGTNLPMEASTTGINFTGTLTQAGTTLQPTLVSGTNIKTINGTTILGSGNIVTPTTSPSGVAGAIQFSNGSAFASDAANLFWDDTNNRLGIGTNAPTRQVELVGSVASPAYLAVRYGTATGGGPVLALDAGSAGLNYLIISTTSSNGSVGANALGIFDGTDYRVVLKSGNLGIGEVAPSARLQVKGSGSTSATTSLLVQNSAGTQLFKIDDVGDATMGFGNSNTAKLFFQYPLMGGGIIFGDGLGGSSVYGRVSLDRGSGEMRVGAVSNGGYFLTLYSNGSEAVRIDTVQSIGIGTTTINASAKVQVDSTTKGFLPPRMTTTQKNAIATPAAGLVVYDNTTNKLCCYNGSTWNDLF